MIISKAGKKETAKGKENFIESFMKF